MGSLARSTTEIGGVEGGIFGKIYYGDWRDWRVGSLARSTTGIGGTGGWDLWQDPLRGGVVCHLRLVLVFCLRIAVYSCSWKFSPRSVPRFDAKQIIVAALWVSRPAKRLPRSKFRESGAQVTSVSCRISHMIGASG